MKCNRALGNATPNYKAFAEGCIAASRIFELIEREPPIDADNVSGKKLERVTGNLELRNVDFTYPTRTDVPIFENFSLQVPAGTPTATCMQILHECSFLHECMHDV